MQVQIRIRKIFLIQGIEGNDNPVQYPYLGNPMDKGAWQTTVQGVTKSWTQLSDTPTPMASVNSLMTLST